VIYIDSSVAIASLIVEPRSPPPSLWAEPLVSSKLLEYEVWNRVHAYGLGGSHGSAAGALLRRIDLIELSETVLARALRPFPVAVRTLDGLHLATLEYVGQREASVQLASYDTRLIAAAQALGVPLATV
jgi:uncharacterized protein